MNNKVIFGSVAALVGVFSIFAFATQSSPKPTVTVPNTQTSSPKSATKTFSSSSSSVGSKTTTSSQNTISRPNTLSSTSSAIFSVSSTVPNPIIQSNPSKITESSIVLSPQSTKYKDGTYSTNLSYPVPKGGKDELVLELVIKNNTIVSSTTSHNGDREESERYQGGFESKYKSQVEGKKIDETKLSRTGGASLTTGAFNKSVDAIKVQARI